MQVTEKCTAQERARKNTQTAVENALMFLLFQIKWSEFFYFKFTNFFKCMAQQFFQ